MKFFCPFLFFILCCCTSKENSPVMESVIQQDGKQVEAIINESTTMDSTTIKPLENEQPDVVINKKSLISLDSIAIEEQDGERWFIGKAIADDILQQENCQITSTLFGVPFGPMNGYDNGIIRIGWNNQRRVLYIEVCSDTVKTYDGLRIGDTREKVKAILGEPYKDSSSEYRYQNIEFEVVGIIFQFSDDKISKIILFSYV